jgi:hypothetical protein
MAYYRHIYPYRSAPDELTSSGKCGGPDINCYTLSTCYRQLPSDNDIYTFIVPYTLATILGLDGKLVKEWH